MKGYHSFSCYLQQSLQLDCLPFLIIVVGRLQDSNDLPVSAPPTCARVTSIVLPPDTLMLMACSALDVIVTCQQDHNIIHLHTAFTVPNTQQMTTNKLLGNGMSYHTDDVL